MLCFPLEWHLSRATTQFKANSILDPWQGQGPQQLCRAACPLAALTHDTPDGCSVPELHLLHESSPSICLPHTSPACVDISVPGSQLG